jgi:hypothetical protein
MLQKANMQLESLAGDICDFHSSQNLVAFDYPGRVNLEIPSASLCRKSPLLGKGRARNGAPELFIFVSWAAAHGEGQSPALTGFHPDKKLDSLLRN